MLLPQFGEEYHTTIANYEHSTWTLDWDPFSFVQMSKIVESR